MTEPRQQYSTRTKYEFQFGYSRAVRQGNVIRVAGTAGLGENGQVVSDDVVEQARRALEIMRDEFQPNTWKAFWATVVEEKPPAEVAKELGMSVTAVYAARLAARKQPPA